MKQIHGIHETEQYLAGRSRPPEREFSVRLLAHGRDQDPAVISVRGELDLETGPMVMQAVLRALGNDRGPVVIDLSEVPFMDSTGVHVLLDALERLSSQDRRLVVACAANGQVRRLLSLSGLLAAMPVRYSRDEAVAAATGVDPTGPPIALAMARRREPAGPTAVRARRVG